MRLNKKSLKIAARHSDLARLQAFRVGDALKAKIKDLDVEYAFRASLGDLNQTDPLWKMPEKGVFTEDFLKDLKDGAAEMVVHSWKDLPTEVRPETEIAATLPRADIRDLLLFRRDRLADAKTSGRVRVLTSSPRRAHNLKAFLQTHLPFQVSEVVFESVRGNIPTRLKKLLSQDVDALIVAKAALDRLVTAREPEFAEAGTLISKVLAETRFMVLPLTVNPTAAAQGALAVEISRDREDVREALQLIHCAATFACVEKERRILASYGGGCHQKIGVSILERPYGEITFLRGLTDAGETLDRVELKPKVAQPCAANQAAIFPRAREEAAFFDRQTLGRETWAWAEQEQLLWVARETAWPQGFQPKESAIVWTAGLRTWQKLAERGVWVSGTSESLGEEEPTRLEPVLKALGLIDEHEADGGWVKLTHTSSKGERLCATYRLSPKIQTVNLAGRTHFYWMSGSSFDRAVELYPEILGGYHASGPGLTHRHLKEKLNSTQNTAQIAIHLSVEDWRSRVLGAKI
jgi:hydroxymethylbilane synthase